MHRASRARWGLEHRPRPLAQARPGARGLKSHGRRIADKLDDRGQAVHSMKRRGACAGERPGGASAGWRSQLFSPQRTRGPALAPASALAHSRSASRDLAAIKPVSNRGHGPRSRPRHGGTSKKRGVERESFGPALWAGPRRRRHFIESLASNDVENKLSRMVRLYWGRKSLPKHRYRGKGGGRGGGVPCRVSSGMGQTYRSRAS